MNVTGIPEYLLPYAEDVRRLRDGAECGIRCSCGCRTFALYRNILRPQEQKTLDELERGFDRASGWHTVRGGTGQDGKPFCWVRKWFFFRKTLDVPELPAFAGVRTVKAICESCGKEILLFDSRLHGWDAPETPAEALAYVPAYSGKKPPYRRVSVRFEQTEVGETDPLLFSSVRIYRHTGNRKQLFFDMETA